MGCRDNIVASARDDLMTGCEARPPVQAAAGAGEIAGDHGDAHGCVHDRHHAHYALEQAVAVAPLFQGERVFAVQRSVDRSQADEVRDQAAADHVGAIPTLRVGGVRQLANAQT